MQFAISYSWHAEVLLSLPYYRNQTKTFNTVVVLLFQAEASGKPKMAIEKMVEGRLRKYFENAVFMDQKFIMNDTMNVKVCYVSVN